MDSYYEAGKAFTETPKLASQRNLFSSFGGSKTRNKNNTKIEFFF